MSYSFQVMFPMSINATQLFEEIQKNAAPWRAQMDATNRSRAVFDAAANLPPPPSAASLRNRIGKHINLVA